MADRAGDDLNRKLNQSVFNWLVAAAPFRAYPNNTQLVYP
jgi:hypothetical protein